MDDALHALVEQVREAHAGAIALRIEGGRSKSFYGEAMQGRLLDVSGLRGVLSHEPSELVVTARCGTPLAALEALLAQHGQCLPFEPPHFSPHATVGGMVSAGLAGPSRARAGSVRDHVLGIRLLDGRGEVLNFGGRVMKNVAGYDVSRVLCGALGTLGVVLEVSLKVMPRAPARATLRFALDEGAALQRVAAWASRPLPLNATAWCDGTLTLRLCGAEAAVASALAELGGERVAPDHAEAFWNGLREQTGAWFAAASQQVERGALLWRLSVPATTPPLGLPGDTLIEWQGAQRWLVAPVGQAGAMRAAAARAGGHAVLFRGADRAPGVFAPPTPALARIHSALKATFDPKRIFNAGRLYPGL